MSKSTVQAIREIRAAVKDESGTVWDATADLLPRLNESLHRLWAEKPEAFYTSKIIVTEPAELTSIMTGSLPVLDQYAPAVVAYTAASLLQEGRRDGDMEASAVYAARWTGIIHPRRR